MSSGDLQKLKEIHYKFSNSLDLNTIKHLDIFDQTPLFSIFNIENHDIQRKIAVFLVENMKLDPNFLDSNNQSVLFYAARHGCIPLAEYLIRDCGVSINLRDNIKGQSPIFYAAANE